jgi:hypothetical protein
MSFATRLGAPTFLRGRWPPRRPMLRMSDGEERRPELKLAW